MGSKEKYLNELFGLKDPDLDFVRAQLRAHDLEFMALSEPEARLLQFLVRGFQVEKIVEVGTLFGFSALAMAQALPAHGKLWTLEKKPENWTVAKAAFDRAQAGSKILSLCGDADVLLKQIESQGPFDLVFIDANKAGYPGYLDWAERNVRRGGWIVGDNTFLSGAVYGESNNERVSPTATRAMQEFNRRMADGTQFHSTLIPTHEGMTVAQKL